MLHLFAILKKEIKNGNLIVRDFHDYVKNRKYKNRKDETIGKYFDIYYGQKNLK